ncbi:aminotransferase [Nonomuraea sp. NPDC003707]
MRLSPRTVRQIDSPFGEARELENQRRRERDLLDLSQAAPCYPAAPAVVEHIAAIARDPHGGDYTDIAGLPHLREAFAADLSQSYLSHVRAEQIVITAGCNQAFCLVVSALAEAGDEVVLAVPYYPNHDMWLRLNGIRPVYLEPGPDLLPSPETAEALITPRTRAIVLVTPGNPSGVTAGPEAIERLAEVARRHDLALILDETYRSFRDTAEPAHRLLSDPRWEQTVVSLHSFSKDYAIPGYRVGALVASPLLNREVMKLLDCVAICAPRIGQEAAWAGLTLAQEWKLARAREMEEKRRRFAAVMAERPGGFELVSAGGFYGWIRHPFAGRPTEEVVRDLAITYDTLVIPGTAFLPEDGRMLRASFSNVDQESFTDFAGRLTAAGMSYMTIPAN